MSLRGRGRGAGSTHALVVPAVAARTPCCLDAEQERAYAELALDLELETSQVDSLVQQLTEIRTGIAGKGCAHSEQASSTGALVAYSRCVSNRLRKEAEPALRSGSGD